MLEFREITLADREIFARYTGHTHSAYDSFAYWYAWGAGRNMLFATDERALYLQTRYVSGERYEFVAPLVRDPEASVAPALEVVRSLMGEQPVLWTPECTKRLIERDCPGLMEFEVEREFAEYIYRVQDLIELEGHEYRSKRNRIRSFTKKHPDLVYHPYTLDYLQACLDLDRDWDRSKVMEIVEEQPERMARQVERQALERALGHYEEIGAKGCVITEGERVVGFSLGCETPYDMVIIHFEKCHPEYRDMYAWLNREFLVREWSHLTYVDREEDIGDIGLRTAKLSYRPCAFANHYQGRFVG